MLLGQIFISEKLVSKKNLERCQLNVFGVSEYPLGDSAMFLKGFFYGGSGFQEYETVHFHIPCYTRCFPTYDFPLNWSHIMKNMLPSKDMQKN